MVYMFQQHEGGAEIHFDPTDGYTETIGRKSGWFSGSGKFDSAMDQHRDICYYYHKNTGIVGLHYDPNTGESRKVFKSETLSLYVPSLTVEHSTGNLVIVGPAGLVTHIDVSTGVDQDISATDGIGIPDTGTGSHYIYGKFDLIEKIPCVGVGLSDAREGVYLMTLPGSVCSMGVPTGNRNYGSK